MSSCQKGIPGAFKKFTITLDEWRKLHAESVQRGIALDRTLRKIVIYQSTKSRDRMALKEQDVARRYLESIWRPLSARREDTL